MAKKTFFKNIASKIFKKELTELADVAANSTYKTIKMSSGMGGSFRSGQKFKGGLSYSGGSQTIDHMSTRQNARSALYDTTQAKSIEQRYADTVVDVGLKLKPAPHAKTLGMNQDRLEEWAEDVAERFHAWAISKQSDLSGVNNFYQNQRMYQQFQTRDNDIFVRFHYSREKALMNPLQLQFIDPNQIRGVAFTSTFAQTPRDDGIERDLSGKEKKYKIWYVDQKGKYKKETVTARGAKSGKTFMIHGFNPEYAGQGRGYSKFLHALHEFEKLTDFTSSHIIKAINQSSIFMYTKPSKDNPASNVMEGRVSAAIPDDYYAPNTGAADNTEANQFVDSVNWSPVPEATLDDPGAVYVANLQEGEDLTPFPNTAPADNYDTFVDSFTAYLAASMSMPIEVLLMRFNANYSASRGALILFWRVAQICRHEIASDYLNPVYESWISGEIASGRISAPGFSDPVLKQAWLMADWMGAPMPNIDPLKEAKAKKEFVELGAETLDDVAMGHNSSSGKSNRAKNKRQAPELTEFRWQQSSNTRR